MIRLDPAAPLPTGATTADRLRLDVYVAAVEFRALSAHAQACFAVLYSFTRPDDPIAWPAVETLAEVRGVCRRRLQLDLAELVEAGLVARTWRYIPSEGQTSTLYRLLVPPSLRVTAADELPLDGQASEVDLEDELVDPDLDLEDEQLDREFEAGDQAVEDLEVELGRIVYEDLVDAPQIVGVGLGGAQVCTGGVHTYAPEAPPKNEEDGPVEYPRPPGSGAPARTCGQGSRVPAGEERGGERASRVPRNRDAAVAWLVDLLERVVLDDGPPPARWSAPSWSDVDALTVRVRGGRVRLSTGDVQVYPGVPDRPDGLRRRDFLRAMMQVHRRWSSPELRALVLERQVST